MPAKSRPPGTSRLCRGRMCNGQRRCISELPSVPPVAKSDQKDGGQHIDLRRVPVVELHAAQRLRRRRERDDRHLDLPSLRRRRRLVCGHAFRAGRGAPSVCRARHLSRLPTSERESPRRPPCVCPPRDCKPTFASPLIWLRRARACASQARPPVEVARGSIGIVRRVPRGRASIVPSPRQPRCG